MHGKEQRVQVTVRLQFDGCDVEDDIAVPDAYQPGVVQSVLQIYVAVFPAKVACAPLEASSVLPGIAQREARNIVRWLADIEIGEEG